MDPADQYNRQTASDQRNIIMTIPESIVYLSRSFKSHEKLFNGRLWTAALKWEKFRLVDFIKPKSGIYSVETYQNHSDEYNLYYRINLPPETDRVPTIVAGKIQTIKRYAAHDHQLILPLTEMDSVQRNLLKSEPALSLLFLQDDVGYYVRSSSFVLDEVNIRGFFSKQAKFIVMRYMLGGKRDQEFFAHIHTLDENSWLLPNYRALLLTNSQGYINNHPEYDYIELNTLSQPKHMTDF